ncbi:MAG TPA: hypothetical protein VFR21_03575 [Bradyrhizobium sp.]|nr:hypothetical protein [Bradyrhizobium sp.]
MCMLCDDEKAYQAYMNYLDAMERQGKDGKAVDPDKAVNAVLDQLEAADKANAEQNNNNNNRNRFFADDLGNNPADDKTLSPFFCSPINK